MNALRSITVGGKDPAEFLVAITPGLRFLNFAATGPIPAVKILAQDIQNQMGFLHPVYGPPALIAHEPIGQGGFITRWRCQKAQE